MKIKSSKPQKQKVSETLLRFAEPVLLEMAKDGGAQDDFRAGLMIVVTVWNSAVMAACGKPESLTEARRSLVGGRDDALQMVEWLVARKQNEFAQDHWLIGKHDLYQSPTGLRLKAVAHKPPRPLGTLH